MDSEFEYALEGLMYAVYKMRFGNLKPIGNFDAILKKADDEGPKKLAEILFLKKQ